LIHQSLKVLIWICWIYEQHDDKTNIVRLHLRSLIRIHAAFCMLTNPNTSRETDSEQHGSWSVCTDAQAGLDPCWSQTHYGGFVMAWLKLYRINIDICTVVTVRVDLVAPVGEGLNLEHKSVPINMRIRGK
jgi:hypothetical protein